MPLFLSRALYTVIVLVLLSACQTLAPDFEKPEIQVTSIRALPAESSNNALNLNMAFDIGLLVTNPNNKALSIRGISYDIMLGDSKLIRGLSNDIPSIEPYGSAEFSTTATLNLFSGISFFTDFMQQNTLDSLPYSINAKIDTGIPLVGRINIQKSGEVSLTPSEQ